MPIKLANGSDRLETRGARRILALRSAHRVSCHVARRQVLPQACGLEQVRPTHPAWSAIRSITGGAMVDVAVVVVPRRGSAVRAASSVVQPGRPSADRSHAARGRIRSGPFALSEARRTWNRDRIGSVSDFRCECARPGCRDRVPAVAETHRRLADQLVVSPGHFDRGIVVRAADRFFVVEVERPREPSFTKGDDRCRTRLSNEPNVSRLIHPTLN
jgi:hypothetical protein